MLMFNWQIIDSHAALLMNIIVVGPCKFHGGETEALRRLDEKISAENKSYVLKFEKPNTSPNSIEVYLLLLSYYIK